MAPPADPSALSVIAQQQAVILSWTASATAGVTYAVYRSVYGSFVQIGTTPATTYADLEVLNGIVYSYKVVATKGGETSNPTNVATVTYTGPAVSFYQAERISEDALKDRKGAATVAAGVIYAGTGEWARLQKLRGTYASCGT